MSTVTHGVKRTEGYVYNTLHWAFPMVPFLALALSFGDAPLAISLAFLALTTLASVAGLSVLHTQLRDAELLPASRWDRFRTRHLGVVTAVWAVTSLGAAVLGAAQGWRDLFVTVAVPAFLGSVLALPLLPRRIHPVVVGLTAIALGELALWGWPSPGEVDMKLRITATYWVGFIAAMVIGFAVMFLNVLETTRELERARDTDAKLAVAEERLRFSRDLHDVFGRTLSAVALKAELGAAQAERGRPEAAATMREVQAIATDALAEVREVVRGYREADLATEIAGARSLLEASGASVSTVVDGAESLPGPVARAFAWTVREATTNALRHADARSVRISVSVGAAGAVLEVANDRPRAAPSVEGSGLAGLTERLREVGGTLAVRREAGWFMLTASVDAEALRRLADAEGSGA